MKGLTMTRAEAEAHQVRHGFLQQNQIPTFALVVAKNSKRLRQPKQPNKTENEFGRMLEAKLNHGDLDVMSYKYEAITLHWGEDDKTGATMRYTPDWVVRQFGGGNVRLVEVKGGHIFSRDIVRFKGCRAEWQWLFDFELWQKKNGQWNRLE